MVVPPVLIIGVIVAFYLISSIKILNEYERAVVFRLGKLLDRPKGPGVILIFAPIDRMTLIWPVRLSSARTAPSTAGG